MFDVDPKIVYCGVVVPLKPTTTSEAYLPLFTYIVSHSNSSSSILATYKYILSKIFMMVFSLYDATIVESLTSLKTLDHILTEAEKHPNSSTLPQARLYADMNPLTFQIHAATRFTEKLLARLTGRDAKEFTNDLVTFADMHARIADAIAALETADKEVVNRIGEEVAPTDLPSAGTMDLTGKAFAMGAAVPNMNFHVSMAYAILRMEGVPLGKRDYIMGFVNEHILKPQ